MSDKSVSLWFSSSTFSSPISSSNFRFPLIPFRFFFLPFVFELGVSQFDSDITDIVSSLSSPISEWLSESLQLTPLRFVLLSSASFPSSVFILYFRL